jgi:hypothetical protein
MVLPILEREEMRRRRKADRKMGQSCRRGERQVEEDPAGEIQEARQQ